MDPDKAVPFAVLLILVLPTIGSVRRGASWSEPLNSKTVKTEPAELRNLLRQANALYRAGCYLAAIGVYEQGYAEAKRLGNSGSAVRFLNNLGSAHYQVFHYRDAIRVYLKARDIARSRGDLEMQGALDLNLSSLYTQMGETGAAWESARQGLKIPAEATKGYKPKLQIQSALLQVRQKAWGQAMTLLQDAVEQSRAGLDFAAEAQAWNELGNVRLATGQPELAAPALLEAFRLRKLRHDDRIYYTYESLGRLSLLRGDPQAAVMLFDRAIGAAPSNTFIWSIYYEKGKARLAQGQLGEAFEDFRTALKFARLWRAEVIPADAFRISTDVKLHQVYSSFIELGGRLYTKTGQAHFLEETFAAAEESRAASLRALLAGSDLTEKLPREYWETLADLHRAETDLLRGHPARQPADVEALRLKVAEIEASAGLELPPYLGNVKSDRVLERVRKALGTTDAYLGFHFGESGSFLWIVAREAVEFRQLNLGSKFAEDVASFAEAIRVNSPEAASLGRRIYWDLFGGISPRLRQKPVWILGLDGPLFELPFAALVEETGETGNPVYVVERHVIRVIPGVAALFPSKKPAVPGPFVALGDPIYNRADPRWQNTTTSPVSTGDRVSAGGRPDATPSTAPMELARLVGSGREIEECTRIWRSSGRESILLSGAGASKENLMATLRRNPPFLHLAVHVVFPSQSTGPGMIALALQPGAQVELLGPTEVAAMRLKLGLVVLNGCSSAKGAVLPGAGLMGMTRSWLAAGATAVIATRWATADPDGGDLFRPFYSQLSNASPSLHAGSFARILQHSQLTELRGGGSHSRPAYWASYFCVERN